jgi:hypothetical protein
MLSSTKGIQQQVDQLAAFEPYRVQNPEAYVGGTGLLKQGLLRLLVERLGNGLRKNTPATMILRVCKTQWSNGATSITGAWLIIHLFKHLLLQLLLMHE